MYVLERNARRFMWQKRINGKPLMKSKIREAERSQMVSVTEKQLGHVALRLTRAEHRLWYQNDLGLNHILPLSVWDGTVL